MIKISKFTCEYKENNCITDNLNPRFNYIIESKENNITISSIKLIINNWEKEVFDGNQIIYDGPELEPFTKYNAKLIVKDSNNNSVEETITFETGFLSKKWSASWISDPTYTFKEKKVAPKVMIFRKNLNINKKIKSATIYSTALGIYDIYIDNNLISKRYFAPGFTSYKHQLQYQHYDVTSYITNNSNIHVVVAGGWAVGPFVMNRKNRITNDKQALLLQMKIVYEDGQEEIIISDSSWEVSIDNQYLLADFYDGETYDANKNFDSLHYHNADVTKVKVKPKLIVDYGAEVISHEKMIPTKISTINDKTIYDFHQNFAGVIVLKIKNATKGQRIIIKHAEILNKDGTLNTVFLRSAKATITYICKEGEQTYSPRFTYMGFRYISIEGINEDDYEISAVALYSNIEQIGDFKCSNHLINKLQSNILWSAKSNLMDIPTDCPQRDERMGWTGDIALFAPTASYNFFMNRFYEKWLLDLKSEQLKTGGIPNTIPSQSYGFPTTMPTMAIEYWGDAVILVPYAQYLATGDISIIKKMYPNMKKYVNACIFWAHLLSFGLHRYIWNTPSIFHFGDWVAPDVKKMSSWQKRSKYTATASLKNTSYLLSQFAQLLGYDDDYKYFLNVSNKTSEAYSKLLLKNGRLKNEFQTGYVLPLQYNMLNNEDKNNALQNLLSLIKNNDYCIGTGFPGTPYILFVLSDNGYTDDALKMLLNTKCPSWLYEVKVGGTSIWERWDGLNENGECDINNDGTGGMISYNHYASGAVGDFLYRRIAGIEPISPGYKQFKIKPLISDKITSCSSYTITPFGKISVNWNYSNDIFTIDIEVPIFTTCEYHTPSGKILTLQNGKHSLKEKFKLTK